MFHLYTAAVTILLAAPLAGADGGTDPLGAEPLVWEGDLDVRMMDGLHVFVERKIAASVKNRPQYWNRMLEPGGNYAASIEPNRQRFRQMIGAVDPRVSAKTKRMERFGDDDSPALVAQTERYRVFQVRWPVLENVHGEGLLLEPLTAPVGQVVAVPDADQTPEQLAGLAPGIAPQSQFARHLAENGFRVVVPVLIDRSDKWSGNDLVAYTNQPHREWIYRQAYQMGRHVIGYEVQKIEAVVDWLVEQQAAESGRIGVAGYGEGGLIAFYAAAVDSRIDACLASGCFDPRERIWEEPLYRNLFGYLREFGDAEVASLIAPRGLVVEYSEFPVVNGPPAVRAGRRGGAAPGRLVTPLYAGVQAEFQRIAGLVPANSRNRYLIRGEKDQPVPFGSAAALEQFARLLSVDRRLKTPEVIPADRRQGFSAAERQRRQVKELEAEMQRLVRGADHVRDAFFLSHTVVDQKAPEKFTVELPRYRKILWEEVLGKFDDPLLPPKPRVRKIYDREKWTGYEIVLDVFPEVFAWGVLLVPKDLKPGEKRPVVVCQHGRRGLPRDVIEGDLPAYHDFAARLAERGFITFAPHNPYRGEDRYRYLSRKGNAVKASLFSFILAQHEQILNWLEKLPHVDPRRIAFYGLSYGGETAVRVPPLLERYCLSICSADFNDWARKVASTDARYSFMFTIEWEMPYFNLGSTFNYAEMAYLMVPRPFMVERGHADGVAPDEWVAYEYAKVRRLYDQLGLGNRTEIEFFNGGHTINGQGTFRFLEKHLEWPKQ
ncbi:MAG: dienelactone hydrolase family protein [Deltaproteobacteria bacterium]